MTTKTETKTDLHVVLAVTADGSAYREGEPTSWDSAQDSWLAHDDARRAGRRPHVRFYAVRSATDSDPRWVNARTARWPFLGVVGSRGYGTGQGRDGGREKAARHAIRRRVPNPGNPSGVQGMGGWYYRADGSTLAQGLDDLARVAIQRGWIAEGINGRWFVIATASEEA